MINQNEIDIAKFCIESALKQGASAARASLSKSIIDSYMMLNGELDKVTHSADRSIYLYIYADGRYGNFSTNRLDAAELEDFIGKAISMVRMLGEDICRTLPEASRTATDAKTGRELDLYDECIEQSSADLRLERAGELTQFHTLKEAANTQGFITSSEWGHEFHLISHIHKRRCEPLVEDMYGHSF
jgi:PmbA protein